MNKYSITSPLRYLLDVPQASNQTLQTSSIHSTSLQHEPHVNMNRLGLSVRGKTRLPKLPTDSTLLHTPKWNPNINIIRAIDPHHTCVQAPSHTMRAFNVSCEDRRSKAI